MDGWTYVRMHIHTYGRTNIWDRLSTLSKSQPKNVYFRINNLGRQLTMKRTMAMIRRTATTAPAMWPTLGSVDSIRCWLLPASVAASLLLKCLPGIDRCPVNQQDKHSTRCLNENELQTHKKPVSIFGMRGILGPDKKILGKILSLA